MGEIYLLYRSYEPNTAMFNRALGYISFFSQSNVKATVCFFLPNGRKDKIMRDYPGITFKYYWDNGHNYGKLSKYWYYRKSLKQFIRCLKKGDIVYTYDMQDLLPALVKIEGVSVYHEITEHPETYRMGTRLHFVSIKEYLDVCKKLDGLIVISTALRDYFVKNGIDQKIITIVNIMVDPIRFEGLKKNCNERYIAYCGMVSNNKDGVDKLIKAFSVIAGKHPDVKLYIIGSIPVSENQHGNFRMIEDLGIKDRVVWTGGVTADMMPQLLKNAEILALARPDNRQAKYGFPTKLGEYMLSENPVVVTKVGDIPLFLNDGFNAKLCEPDEIDQFADKLSWLLEHPSEATQIGLMGAKTAKTFFNSNIESQKLLSVLLKND